MENMKTSAAYNIALKKEDEVLFEEQNRKRSIKNNKNYISIKKRNGILIDDYNADDNNDNYQLALTFAANVMNLGFILSEELLNKIRKFNIEEFEKLNNNVIPVLKNIVGDDVEYNPMYPNFPQQVMEMSYAQLFFNAILHYLSFGEWTPSYEKIPREFAYENNNFYKLDIITKDQFYQIFIDILSSNASISGEDLFIVEWFLDNEKENIIFPQEIPFKENLCVVASKLLRDDNNKDYILKCIKTSTDLLRVITYLSDGDISLSQYTLFKSFPRSLRKLFISILENVINEDDIQRHRNKWVKVFHILHIGDYKKIAPKSYEIAKKIRNNEKLQTFASEIEDAIKNKDVDKAINLLVKRPGDFARRLDHLLRKFKQSRTKIVENFISCSHRVSTRVLLQLLGHFNERKNTIKKRVVFPKSNIQKAYLLKEKLPSLGNKTVSLIKKGIEETLNHRFSQLSSLGNVYVDNQLKECPIPMQQRGSSDSLFTVARGTRIPLNNKNTLRFFIYWVGQDIDLSATIHGENLEWLEEVSYTNLKSEKYSSYHSGDITMARNGASEFIDINKNEVIEMGGRYVVMNVFVFAGPSFNEHKVCYAGFMGREHPNSNEVYDPQTVEQKIDLSSQSRMCIPMIFDLKENKMIWCDLASTSLSHRWGNNVHSNQATIQDIVESMINLDNKPTLYDLFSIHANARGNIVKNRKDADTIFSLKNGEVTPYDVNTINSYYLK